MTRTRDKSTVVSYPYEERFIEPDFNWSRSGTTTVVQEDRMVDVITPRFKRRSAEGAVIINPMTKSRSSTSLHPVNFWKQRVTDGEVRGFERTLYWPYHDYLPWSDPYVAEYVGKLEALAITDAYAGVGSPDLATLTELAELRETLNFLWSPVAKMKYLTQFLKSTLRKYNRLLKGYERALNRWMALPPHIRSRRAKPEPPKLPPGSLGGFSFHDIPSLWLAYRYAIMPLIYSFQDIQKHLDRAIYPERDTSRAKQEGSLDLGTVGGWTQYDYPNGNTYERNYRVGTAKIVSRAGVLYCPDWSLNRQLGLQIHRVPVALYEAIPLSFVTDWFHNTASVYDALTAELRSLKILGAWVTTKIEFNFDGFLEAMPADAQTSCCSTLHCVSKNGEWKRRRLAPLSDVQLHFRVDMNGKRIADALSLIYSMLVTARKST